MWGTKGDGSYFNFNYANGVYTPTHTKSDSLVPVAVTYDEWKITDGNGKIDHFKKLNGSYRLVASYGRNGVSQSFTYDADNRLQTIVDSFGRMVQVIWKNKYAVDSLKGPAFSVHYQYDQLDGTSATLIAGAERLIGVTVKTLDGMVVGSKQYHYEDPYNRFLLTGITDENGVRYATYAYNSQGQVILTEHAGGTDRHIFSYPTNDWRIITDPLGTDRSIEISNVALQGRVTAVGQPGGAGCNPAAASLAYADDGNLSSRTDFNGSVTTYSYDLSRNLETRRTEAAGTAQARTVSTAWHLVYRLPVKIAEPGRMTTFTHDASGNILSKTEQATADPTGAAGFAASLIGLPRIWRWTYNGFGQTLTVTGPRTGGADITTFTYDNSTGNLQTIRSALGHVTTLSNYNAHGHARKIVAPDGVTTDLTYHPRGWLTSRTISGPDASETTAYTYDGVGQVQTMTLPDTTAVNFQYDNAHRLIGMTDSIGNRIAYTLDAMGNRIAETVSDPNGVLAKTISRNYDALNRLQQITGAAQ